MKGKDNSLTTSKSSKKQGKNGESKLRPQVMTRQLKALVPQANTFDNIPLLYADSSSFQEVDDDGNTAVNWTDEAEIFLLRAILKYRLAGLERHVNAIIISKLLTKAFGFVVTPDIIWQRVNTLFNCEELEDNKVKRTTEFTDFTLPKHWLACKGKEGKDRSASNRSSASQIKTATSSPKKQKEKENTAAALTAATTNNTTTGKRGSGSTGLAATSNKKLRK